MKSRCLFLLVLGLLPATLLGADEAKPLKLLFLGDKAGHRPAERFRQLQPVLARRGIDVTYTEKMESLNPQTLATYDGLMIYANITKIAPEQEKALLDYVEGGKGFIPIHCASYCFLNSPKYIELVGAQFQRHGTGVFRTTIVESSHPVMKGFAGFESWDETYVHTKHNSKNRAVLEYREEKGKSEPWTWVRTQGKGRVFYTAWGHDERTWGNPGFQDLIERGIRWAVGSGAAGFPAADEQSAMTSRRTDVKPFEYAEAKVPFYPAGEKWGTTAEPISKMQKPLEPDESMKHMVHPEGFELRLFASEPMLGGKPIFMNWDERGRLWVAVTVDYPNELQPEGQGRDKIVICEDTDGDGKADKCTVFADKLSIPTSFAFVRGGIVVTQAPHTLFLKDSNGDDVADVRQVLFTGWVTRDTHAGPSNLRYGHDNWLYGMVGYSGFEGRIGGIRQSFRQGFFRLKTDASACEFLRGTNNNSWGVGFSEEGILFGSTANGNPSEYMPIANRYYESVRGWSSSVLNGIAGNAPIHPITDKVRQVDWHGHFTAAAGHALYTARTYPREYWNRTAFVAEPTGHVLSTFVIQPVGAGFRSHNAWNLLASDDEWTSPTMGEVGPDGNVWIVDWYNFIVQHNPTPVGFRTGKGNAYETSLRDKKHGRIYRLVAKGARSEPPLSLKDAPPDKLLETLKHTNLLWRLHAQRLLVERGQSDVAEGLIRLTQDRSVDEIGLNGGVVHALWTLYGLGLLDGRQAGATAAAVNALKHPAAGVRRNAACVLPRNPEGVKALLASGVLNDVAPQVRLSALLALAEMPADPGAATALVQALASAEIMSDRWLPDALTSAAAAHDQPFLRALTTAKPAKSQRALELVTVVAEHFARGGPGQSIGALVASLNEAEPNVAEAVLAGLTKGWPRGKAAVLTGEDERGMTRLLDKLSPGAKGQLVQLATTWGSKSFAKHAEEIGRSLLAEVTNEKFGEDRRIAAALQLIRFRPGDVETVKKVLDAVSARTSAQFAVGIIEAVGTSPSPEIGAMLLHRFVTWPPSARAAGLRVLLGRPETTRTLLTALEKNEMQFTELSLDQKQALAAHPDRRIAARAKILLSRGGGLPNADRQKVIDELMPLMKRTGTVSLGKEVFKKHCATCHTHSGEGNQVGPDLTGMAVHPRAELLTHLMDPNRSVEGNFRIYTVTTKDGRILSGLLASETKTSVELIDAQAKRQTVLREDIDELLASNKSLMPEGFEKQLSSDELVNLMEFMTQRGKYLPLSLDKVATVASTRGMFNSEEASLERLIFPDWKPKVVDGVPFLLVDPQGGRVPNVVLLKSPNGTIPPKMPASVTLPCNAPAKAIHLLSGVSGWGYPYGPEKTVTMIVRLHYADGKSEDHPLLNGVHFADYIRVVDVPGSKLAFRLRGQQIRYLAVTPKRADVIERIELVKGPDACAPVVMAVTLESRE